MAALDGETQVGWRGQQPCRVLLSSDECQARGLVGPGERQAAGTCRGDRHAHHHVDLAMAGRFEQRGPVGVDARAQCHPQACGDGFQVVLGEPFNAPGRHHLIRGPTLADDAYRQRRVLPQPVLFGLRGLRR